MNTAYDFLLFLLKIFTCIMGCLTVIFSSCLLILRVKILIHYMFEQFGATLLLAVYCN
jgi:hypothetical protein